MEGQATESSQHAKALYFLNISNDKLNSDGLKKIKRLLFYILKRVTESLVVELYFEESMQIEYSLIQRILWNGYNLVSM
jgi:hypothetical protein